MQRAFIILGANMEIIPQQLNQGQIRIAAAMGGTKCFEDKTVLLRQHFEFVKQPGLANSRLAHHPDHLALSVYRLCADLFEMVKFFLPTNKARQATRG